MAAVAVSRGRSNFALIYCAESEACTSGAASARSNGSIPDAGGNLAYEAQVSIAQFDFTAECLGARGAGVDAIIAFTDQVGIGRIAGSCARQGYRPTFISSAVDDRVLDDPNLGGFIQSVDTFPWAGVSTPAIEAFKTALATYAPGTDANYFTANAWSAGKLFERALRDATGEITTQTVFDGLHAMSGDDLGLLPSAPDYEPGAPHPGSPCGFAIVAEGGEWVAHDGGRPLCGP
jgi:branched-chain amino acid transport system substrate-binding protein